MLHAYRLSGCLLLLREYYQNIEINIYKGLHLRPFYYQPTAFTMVKLTYRGLCAPVFTVFNDDSSVNIEIVPKYAQYLLDKGIDGVLVHGTTGEGMVMSVAERKLLVEEWAKAVKKTKQHLMIQVGGCPLPDVLELAKHAESIGADSLLCLPELYFKPSTSAQLVKYLKIVGAAAPKTPLLYYHKPDNSGVNINMAEFIEATIGQIPTFQGIKYSSSDLEGGLAALRAAGDKYAVFVGAKTLMAGVFSMGFDSIITSTLNIFPRQTFKIKEAIQQSKMDEARVIQQQLSAACAVITKDGAWIPTMKVAMTLTSPLKMGLAREPQTNLTKEQIENMKKSLTALGIC